MPEIHRVFAKIFNFLKLFDITGKSPEIDQFGPAGGHSVKNYMVAINFERWSHLKTQIEEHYLETLKRKIITFCLDQRLNELDELQIQKDKIQDSDPIKNYQIGAIIGKSIPVEIN